MGNIPQCLLSACTIPPYLLTTKPSNNDIPSTKGLVLHYDKWGWCAGVVWGVWGTAKWENCGSKTVCCPPPLTRQGRTFRAPTPFLFKAFRIAKTFFPPPPLFCRGKTSLALSSSTFVAPPPLIILMISPSLQ